MAFVALEVALELIEELSEVVGLIERRDRDLGSQLRRAASSVALNLAEGSGRRGADRTRTFRIAHGSALEVRAALRAARAWRYVGAAELAPAEARLDRLGALCHGLTRA